MCQLNGIYWLNTFKLLITNLQNDNYKGTGISIEIYVKFKLIKYSQIIAHTV